VDLAKPCLDVGLYTERIDALRGFYEGQVGLPYEELLKAGRGVHQHRLGLRGAVMKLNDSRDPLADAPSGLRGIVIAHPDGARALVDPDGTPVELVAPGTDGVDGVAVRWSSSDPDRLGRLLADGLSASPDGPGRWRVGETLLLVGSGGPPDVGPLRARGFRYLTVQVRDLRTEHARLLDAGWTEGTAPVRLGDVAYISFVRDPDGNWLEVSQRASLTGPLPEDA
jgi:lactoylglutathione lyase